MTKILFILTNYRVYEKYTYLLEYMAESNNYDMTLYMMGQASLNTKWPGDKDLRKSFVNRISNYNNVKIFQDPGISFFGQSPTNPLDLGLDLNDFKLIWYDDNRLLANYHIPKIFEKANSLNIPMIGNSHGNQELSESNINAINKSFDHLFVLGEYERKYYSQYYENIYSGGIPTNDKIQEYYMDKELSKGDYILCITNFLSNHRPLPFNVNFDRGWAILLSELSIEYGKKIKIKQKGRLDDPDYNKNVNYIHEKFKGLTNLGYEIVSDTNNIEELIANSSIVISAMSTLAFKVMSMRKKCILIEDSGQRGNFKLYPYIKKLDSTEIISCIREFNLIHLEEFLSKTIEGSNNFDSSKKYVEKLNRIIQ